VGTAVEIVSFPWGILVGTVVLQISAVREDLPGRLWLNGQLACEVVSVRSTCALDLGGTPRVHEVVLEDARGQVRERVWLNRGPWRPRVSLKREPCDPSYLCFRVSGGHPEKKPIAAIQVGVGEQRWNFGPNQVAKIRAPAEGSVLLVRLEFVDGSITEYAATVGPTLFSEVAETTAGFVVVEKPSGSLPASLCGQTVLGEETSAPPAVAFVLEPGALRRVRFWAKQAQLQPRGLKEMSWFQPADARAWDAAQGALEGAERVLFLGAFGSLPQVVSPQASPGFSRKAGILNWLLSASQAADGGAAQRRRTADAVAVAAFHLATHPGPRAVILARGDEAEDESVFLPSEVREYLRELMVPLVVWDSRKYSGDQWPTGQTVRSVGDLAAAAQELAGLLRRQTVVWLQGAGPTRRCRGGWPLGGGLGGGAPGGSEPLQTTGLSSSAAPQKAETGGETRPRSPVFWVGLTPGASPVSPNEWVVRVGGAVRKVQRAWSPQENGGGRWPCFALNRRFLGEAASGAVKKLLLDHLKAAGAICGVDLEKDPLHAWRTTSASELKEWFRSWERGLPRQNPSQLLRKEFEDRQKPASRRRGAANEVGQSSDFLAQELNLVRRNLGSLLLACEALPPPAVLVVVSEALDLQPERFYSRHERGAGSSPVSLSGEIAAGVGESLAARGCLVFAAVVGQKTGPGNVARWAPLHYDPQVLPPEDAGTASVEELSGLEAVVTATGGKAQALAEFRWPAGSLRFWAVALEAQEGESVGGPLEVQGLADGTRFWYPRRLDPKTHPLVGEELAWRALRNKEKGSLPVVATLVDPVVFDDGSGLGLLRVMLQSFNLGLLNPGEVGRLTVCVTCPGTLPAFSAISVEAPRDKWVLEHEIRWPSKGCQAGVAVEMWPLGAWGAALVELGKSGAS